MSALHCEFVRRADEWQARKLRNFGRRRLAKSGSRTDSGSHGCTAECEGVYTSQCIIDAIEIVAKHARVTRPLLAEGDRCGVLHVRSSNLDDVLPFAGLCRDRVSQRFNRLY